jgi:predicted TIM-barrel fold metal-dependent hydrolase
MPALVKKHPGRILAARVHAYAPERLPPFGKPEEHDVVLEWSRYPNTVLKVSALPRREEYPHRDIAPVVRRAAEAFGADRMVYGGGSSAEATAESYRACRERVRALLAFLSAADQAKVLGATAARIFRSAKAKSW